MSVSILHSRWHTLKLVHTQPLQQTLVINPQLVLLVFRSRYEIWNIKTSQLVKGSSQDENIFYRGLHAIINQRQVAFINFSNLPQIGVYKFETDLSFNLRDLSQHENYHKIFIFTNGQIVVVSTTKMAVKANILQGPEFTSFLYSSNTQIAKYNSADTFVVFQTEPSKDLQFTLVTSETPSKYTAHFSTEYRIVSVQQCTPFQAIILAFYDSNTSAFIFNLQKGVIQDTFKIGFPADSLLKGSLNTWLATNTSQSEDQSQFVVQQFFSSDNRIVVGTIPLWERVENDFYPCFVIKSEGGIVEIETKSFFKKETYITYLLEKCGVIQQFGSEIVKDVVNNLI